MRAEPSCAAGTARAISATRRPLANLSCGTAITAFGTLWFAYLMPPMAAGFLLSL